MNSPEAIPVVVETASGKLEGSRKGATSVFKGIPFATARRWEMPERAAPWAGVRPAREAGPMAPQNPSPLEGWLGLNKGTHAEDCLSLNVWTPACDGGKRPVMVWIHGGAFVTGSGSTALYDGTRLSQAGDVVVVTINYRLGSLGFLRLAEVTKGRIRSTGAEGLADQVRALEWVRDSIQAFGGDPGNVTIFGESAGSMSVVSLMAMPSARGLFHKVICQSGGGHLCHPTAHADRVAEVFLQHLGDGAKDLHNVGVDALLKAQLALLMEVDQQQDPHRLGTMAFQPTVDGVTLPTRPIDAVRQGSARGIALVTGTTSEEWKLWTALDSRFHEMDAEKLLRWAGRMFGAEAQRLIDADGGATPYHKYVSMQTNRAFREPAMRLLEAQGQYAPVHDYIFDWRSPAAGGVFGACHAIELGFVFGTHRLPGADQFFGSGPEAEALSAAMISAWTSFARHGRPATAAGAGWEPWSPAAPRTMVFGSSGQAAQMQDLARDAVWQSLPDGLVGANPAQG